MCGTMADAPGSYEIALPPSAGPGVVAQLVAELARHGVAAEVPGNGPAGVLCVAAATTPALTAVAAFVRRSLSAGLVLDLAVPVPRLTADAGLPAGSVKTIQADGDTSLRERLGDQQVGYLLRAGLATTWR